MVGEIVEGVVTRVNDHGFQLAGRNGWLNLSKYAKPTPPLPREGTQVEVGLDRAGYVRAVRLLISRQDDPSLPGASGLLCSNNEEPAPAVRQREVQPALSGASDCETRIMRQAVLNTATAILGSEGRGVRVADVLALAATLESWVSR